MRLSWLMGIALFILQGCASTDHKDTFGMDWHAIGYADGMRGEPAERFRSHLSGGKAQSTTAGVRAYHAGRAAGLRIYCDPSNGFALGARGGRYTGICPTDLEPAFIETYAMGRLQHDSATDIGRTGSQVGGSPD